MGGRMTLSEIEEAARNRYNAIGDNNWSEDEIIQLVYQAALEITRDCGILIEKKFQTTSIDGTGEYSFPEQAASIKRITYDGRKLKEISMREDDALTLENQLTTDTGDPADYWVWNRTFSIRPIPSVDGDTIEVFAICNEQSLVAGSTLDLPERFHGSLITFVVREMSAKDLNWAMYDRYDKQFQDEKLAIRKAVRKDRRGDAFRMVQVEELLPYNSTGIK
jgi:hypothetical protein